MAWKALIHFNKPGSKQNPPKPWTVHWRGACYQVAEINCLVITKTEFKPNKKDNPKAYLTAQISDINITNNIATLS